MKYAHIIHLCPKQMHCLERAVPGDAVMWVQAVSPVCWLCPRGSSGTLVDGVQARLSGKVHDVVLVVHVDALPRRNVALGREGDVTAAPKGALRCPGPASREHPAAQVMALTGIRTKANQTSWALLPTHTRYDALFQIVKLFVFP